MKKVKIKRFLIGLITTALLLGGGTYGVTYGFDKEVNRKAFEKTITHTSEYTFVSISALGTASALYREDFTQNWVTKEVFWHQMGSGTVIVPGYIITAAHVVKPDKVQVADGKYSTYLSPVNKILSRTILIHDGIGHKHVGWVHYVDVDRDVAIIRYVPSSNNILVPLYPAIQYEPWESMLHVGDKIAIVVHLRGTDECDEGDILPELVVLWSEIVSTSVVGPPVEALPWFSMTDVTINTPLIGGDSGSLVFAFNGGHPYFIGVARAGWGDEYSYFAIIGNHIMRIIGVYND